MPEVSIIINCFNEAEHLQATLDSVFAQTFKDWEIVFWDNASSDASGEIATSYGEKVRYFRNDDTVPLGRARNLAFLETQGSYIAILDADDLWLPEKLERQLQLFKANPQLGMAFCDSMYFDSGGDRYRLFQLAKPHRGYVFGHILAGNFMFSSSMMFRRDALEQQGYAFDERYTRVADWDLSLRVAYSYPVDYVDEPLSKWRMYEMGEKPWKKVLVPQPVEAKLAIDNLIQIYPDIENKYNAELQTFYRRFDYNLGMMAWRNGDLAEARSHLSRHLSNVRFASMYFGTFVIPYKLFSKLKNVYRNKVTASS